MWYVARAIGGALAALSVAALLLAAGGDRAHADGGPHGGYTATAGADGGLPDQCAGCHRAHTALSPASLLIAPSAYALCLTCHNGTGSSLDVVDGVRLASLESYDPGVVPTYSSASLTVSAVPVAVMRMAPGGSFARFTIAIRNRSGAAVTIDSVTAADAGSPNFAPSTLSGVPASVPAGAAVHVELTVTAGGSAVAGNQLLTAVTVVAGAESASVTVQAKVSDAIGSGTLNGGGFWFVNGEPVTSTHDPDPSSSSLNPWGLGANTGMTGGAMAGPLQCTSCHDPHGTANYRLLRDEIAGHSVVARAYYPPGAGGHFVADEGAAGLGPGAPPDKYVKEYYGSTGDGKTQGGAPADPFDADAGNSMSSLCGACHEAYPSIGASDPLTTTDPEVTHYRHATEIPYDDWAHPQRQPGVSQHNPETWFTNYIPEFSLRLASTSSRDNAIVTCLTCHRAHGTATTMSGYALKDLPWLPGTPGVGADPLADPLRVPDVAPSQTLLDKAGHASVSSLLFTDDRGLCQACHQWTGCAPCHQEDGTIIGGGCTGCHSQAVGGRRQIVDSRGDFERTSHHVAGAVQDSDCALCHYLGDHQQGIVKLKSPDFGDALVYNYDPADPGALRPFCLACHDSDGASAAGGLTPFSDGRAVPDVVGAPGSTWDGSAHRLGGVDCKDCHTSNAHGADNIKLLQAPRVDTLCFACHTDGMVNNALAGPVDDIQEAFAQAERHDLGTSFVVGANTYELQCTTCHNPHVATGKHWDAASGVSPVTRPDLTADPLINPRAMGTTLWGAEPGQKMDDFAQQGAGSGGWYYSVARGGVIAFDQQAVYRPPKTAGGGWDNHEFSGDVLPDYTTLCLDCHSYRMSAANPPVNWGQGIACTDNSVDPPDQRVECGAQHGLAAANKPSYWGDVGLFGTSGNPDPIFAEPGVTRGRGAGHFMRWPYDSVDRNAGINFVMSCTDCHESHGSPVGSMLRTVVNDGPGTTIWNTSCNNCHYYYGGQHAGMSCGSASCHEANSIHRIIHVTESGGTFLWTEPSRPLTTPEISAVEGHLGSNEFAVSFTQGVWTNMNQTGSLTAGDFLFTDAGANNPRSILGVTHTPGTATAVVTMAGAPDVPDDGADTLATRGTAVWDVDGDPAGPWPVTTTVCESSAGASFELNEAAASATAADATGLFEGAVGNPAFAFPGDGSFHGDEAQGTYVDFAGNVTCLNSPRALTVEALVKPTEVDRNAGNLGVPDNTFNRIFERRRTLLVTILNTDYRGDDVPGRAGRASIEVKYRVENVFAPGARHTCPNPRWPADPYVGNDVRMHQISSDIDRWPIVDDHWYRVRVVLNTHKGPGHGTPVDIFLDDRGTDGLNAANPTPLSPALNPDFEQWPGYVNATKTINQSSSCKWGALPGDVINDRDDTAHIGASWNHNQPLEGQIDWVTWKPFADYSGVDDVANFGDPPTGVTAASGNGTAELSWDAMPDAVSYNLYWATSPSVTRLSASKHLGASSPQIIGGLTNGTGYYFVVTAVYADGESGPSSEASATPAP